jgi:hypothetical protein
VRIDWRHHDGNWFAAAADGGRTSIRGSVLGRWCGGDTDSYDNADAHTDAHADADEDGHAEALAYA